MYDFKTLTYYGIAAALSLCLSFLLGAFAYFQEGTRSARGVACAILVLATGYGLAACGSELPTWTTRIASNLILLSAAVILHTGFTSFCREQAPEIDRFGWAVIGISILPFGYWGLMEPDGNLRTAWFSMATTLISSRTAFILLTTAKHRRQNIPLWILGSLFAILALWMSVRGTLAAFTETADHAQRAANPTAWTEVLVYILLVALLTGATLWLEIGRLRSQAEVNGPAGSVHTTRVKLILVWGGVAILNVGIVSAIGFALAAYYDSEKARLIDTAELSNNAFVAYAQQVDSQIDVTLNSVRGYYRRTQSLAETERFMTSLGFDRKIIDNVYLIDSDGNVLTNRAGSTPVNVRDREYFSFHRNSATDSAFISRVEPGRVTGKFSFRLTRRLDNSDGTFSGIVLAAINPEAFSSHFHSLLDNADAIAGLIGTDDHLLRARWPVTSLEWWGRPIESPLWAALGQSATGVYQSVSSIDGVRRTFVYRQVTGLPLVMTTGFSETELMRGIAERIRWPAATAGVVMAAILILAFLLTIEIRRRDEQDRFMSMLNHELKTPLSVIRMALGSEALSPGSRERVRRAISDMNAIVERSLQADRLSHGQIIAHPAPCQSEKLLATLVGTSTMPGRIRLEAGFQPEIQTDTQLLGVIVTNLIDNALKYGASDQEIRIVTSESALKGKNGLLIEVRNPVGSAGMPDPRLVFRKYYRAPGAHSKTGSGLGLHIAYSLAAKLGGQLSYIAADKEVKFALWMPL